MTQFNKIYHPHLIQLQDHCKPTQNHTIKP